MTTHFLSARRLPSLHLLPYIGGGRSCRTTPFCRTLRARRARLWRCLRTIVPRNISRKVKE